LNPEIDFGKMTIIEPVTNTKSLAENSFLINKILEEFSNAYDKLDNYKN